MLRHVMLALLLGLGGAGVGLSAAGRASANPTAGVVGTGSPASCDEAALDSALAGGGLITFNCGVAPLNILLTSFKTIAQPTTLDGGGLITLDGGDSTRLFVVNSGTSLTLQNIELSNAYSGDSDGGAIVNHGTLALYHAAIFDSAADDPYSGGAIFSDGPLTIVDSDFTYNQAGSAGAIFVNFSQAQVSITDSRFQYNHTNHPTLGYGGAIWVGSQAHLTFTGGHLDDNTAHYGGGLYLSPGAVVTLTGTTGPDRAYVASNAASHSGGGIYNAGGQLALVGAIVQDNTVVTTTPGLGYGGGVASYGPVQLVHTTLFENIGRVGGGLYLSSSVSASPAILNFARLYRNIATTYGGGLFAEGEGSVITVTNTAIEGNYANLGGGGTALFNAGGTVAHSAWRYNQADTGGGLYLSVLASSSAALTVRDSTVTGHIANLSYGGGIYSDGPLALLSTTIFGNTNGLFVALGSTAPSLANTVLHNAGYNNCAGGGGPPATLGDNFASDLTCGLNHLTDQQGPGLDPMLGPLTFSTLPNATAYHAPLPGSPLINAGGDTVACGAQDQLLASRPDGDCDIGAVEFGGALPIFYLPLVFR